MKLRPLFVLCISIWNHCWDAIIQHLILLEYMDTLFKFLQIRQCEIRSLAPYGMADASTH